MAELDDLARMRHSAAHVMAQAVQELYPGTRLGIGPAIEDGFYYDFAFPQPITPEDLPRIEQRMAEIVRARAPFVREVLSREEALALFGDKDEAFKVELIHDLPTGEEISIYRTGDQWLDLCRGPHVGDTGRVGPFRLLTIAGAYWRGDEHRPMLQRIYGTAFATRAELETHLKRLEEAQRRDHRRLGRELDLFSVAEQVGPGLILWHPKGARVRTIVEDYWRTVHDDAGYQLVYTPHVGRAELWRTSGHLDFYRDSMYAPMEIEGQEYYAKPMNCPFHIQIYRAHLRSYRDLPIRLGELGTVYRYERTGVLHGLLRVRGFTQDDSHLFCRPDQVEQEIVGVVNLTIRLLGAFGFNEFDAYISTRPEKFVGDAAMWEQATEVLKIAARQAGLRYQIEEGGGAFYGPKIDLKIRDALGRAWQCTTVQFDFNLPERFHLEYIGEDGQPHRPVMIHRALLGSMERFFGVLIEHYGGAFPVWLAPVQAVVLPIADRHAPYAEQVARQLRAAGLRAEVDARGERIGYKIREAQVQKVPYMLVVGDQEVAGGTVAVRLRSGENLGPRPVADVTTMMMAAARPMAAAALDK
ncbi:MAG: threonine--tRNA ligase [Chloroflexi bacterium]|nr:threonine--tRNA ligase [Chloroflexota bacterium]MBI4505763.1 threonine--tRNA ligase [Chloroflexota bacterium]